jgi:4a-hydroxytetrahydrobiopterin dehydratase
MATIPEAEARERLGKLGDWTLTGPAIRRQLTFKGFPDALAFVVRLGFDAEAADHHPDMLINYRRVTLTYSTHSEGGLTDKDFAGAAAADTLAQRFGGT